MRLFLALELSDAAESALARLQSRLKIGRLTLPEQFHVTLVFLGDVGDSEAEELDLTLHGLGLPLVSLEIAGVGHFGHGKPRLVYAGVTMTEPLRHLQAKLAQAARGVGLQIERRRFVPHVTLARLGGREEDAAAVAEFEARSGTFRLPIEAPRDVVLYRSFLRQDGPVYEELERYRLG